LSAIRLKEANSSADDDGMTNPFRLRAAAKPRPVLVAWTTHYLVEDGRTVAREAWVRFPGSTSPRLVPVTLDAAA
jgi:hypothetical protein